MNLLSFYLCFEEKVFFWKSQNSCDGIFFPTWTRLFSNQNNNYAGICRVPPWIKRVVAVKPHQSHNVASSLMFLIFSLDLVTSDSKATFNPDCSFSFNRASDFNTDTNHHLQTAVWVFPKDTHNLVIWTNTIHNVLCCHRQCIYIIVIVWFRINL